MPVLERIVGDPELCGVQPRSKHTDNPPLPCDWWLGFDRLLVIAALAPDTPEVVSGYSGWRNFTSNQKIYDRTFLFLLRLIACDSRP